MRILADVRGRHEGMSAVILGAGPSVHKLDDRVQRHVVFTVNSSIYKVGNPDYHCAMDRKMPVRLHWPRVMNGTFPVIVPAHQETEHLLRCIMPKDRRVVFSYRGGFNPPDTISLRMGREDTDLLKGGSSVHTAIHAAVVMGCSPIYLVGCDGQKVDGHAYFWEYPGYPKDGYLANLTQVTAPLTYFDQCLRRWEWIVENNPDLDLRDCSGGRVAEVVKPATIEELLGG